MKTFLQETVLALMFGLSVFAMSHSRDGATVTPSDHQSSIIAPGSREEWKAIYTSAKDHRVCRHQLAVGRFAQIP
jgi:hypothetical protein